VTRSRPHFHGANPRSVLVNQARTRTLWFRPRRPGRVGQKMGVLKLRRPPRTTGTWLADEQLESVVPGASGAADLDPRDADRLELARAFDPADVDRIRPAEVGQYVADRALGVLIVSGDQHRRLAF